MLSQDARKVIERALQSLRGDDLERARAAFRHCTEEEMGQEYGQSGQTRRQILQGYLDHNSEIDQAEEELARLWAS